MNYWRMDNYAGLGLWLLAAGMVLAADNASLRLVMSAEGKDYDQFTVEKERVVIQEMYATKPIPKNATWCLEGDLRANARLLLFSPTYRISRMDVPDWIEAKSERPYIAKVLVQGRLLNEAKSTMGSEENNRWSNEDLIGGISVFLWLIDGQVAKVSPVAARGEGKTQAPTAETLFILTEEEKRGAPAALLLGSQGWIAPRPWFSDAAANQALVEMHLGSVEALGAALQGVRDVDHRGERGMTLLHVAAESGLAEAVNLLLARKAKLNLKTQGDENSPLHWAAGNGRSKVVEALLKAKAPRDLQNKDKNSPLHLAVGSGHDDVAIALIAAKADAELINGYVETPVSRAIHKGRTAVVRAMLQQGVDFNFANDQMPRVMITQAGNGHLGMVQLLLEKKVEADVEYRGLTALAAAARRGNRELAETLLRGGAKADHANSEGVTPLMVAAQSGNVEFAAALLVAGADPNHAAKDKRTALHMAVLSGMKNVIALLISKGAKIDALDGRGFTPLEVSLLARVRQSAAALQAAGASLDVKRKSVDEFMEAAIALDMQDVVARGVEAGWDPVTLFYGRWPAWRVAELYNATTTAAWLKERAPAGMPPALVGGSEVEAKPRIRKAFTLDDPRDADENYGEARLEVSGVIDEEGRLRFPIITGTLDKRLVFVALQTLPQWEFAPATKGGQAVNLRISLPVVFPASSERAYGVRELDVIPKVIKQTSPVYPFHLRKSGYMGQVLLSFVVNQDGRTANIRVVRSSHPQFEAAAIAALAQWVFTPGKRGGQTVRTRMVVPIVFSITDE